MDALKWIPNTAKVAVSQDGPNCHFALYSVNAKLAFRFFVKITACPSQKRALEDDDDAPAEEEEHVAKRRDIKPDSKIRVLVVEGKFFLGAHEIASC